MPERVGSDDPSSVIFRGERMIVYKGTVDGEVDERWVGLVLFGSNHSQIQPFLMPEPSDIWMDSFLEGPIEMVGS